MKEEGIKRIILSCFHILVQSFIYGRLLTLLVRNKLILTIIIFIAVCEHRPSPAVVYQKQPWVTGACLLFCFLQIAESWAFVIGLEIIILVPSPFPFLNRVSHLFCPTWLFQSLKN